MSISSRRVVFSTEWFKVVAKKIRASKSPHYSLKMSDYVTVFAITDRNEVVLVSQYRPAVERETLEFPSGHVDEGETPRKAAARELLEETGFSSKSLKLLGVLHTDTGRHENRLWCFFARNVRALRGIREKGIDCILCKKTDFLRLIRSGKFNHALNLALVSMAVIKGRFKWR